jgi:hypothetical protein
MKIGLANYEPKTNKNVKKKYFKLKNGDNFYRILPPCGSLADRGEWTKFYEVHFGYKGSPNEQGNAPYRPFLCTKRTNKFKQVTQSCAECAKIEEVKAQLETLKENLKKDKKKSSEEVKAMTAPLTDFLMQHNLDRKFHLNVKTEDGSIGCLKIPYTAYKDLQETIANVRKKYSVDPLAPDQGVWFNFKRSGEVFYDINYKVEVKMEMVDSPGLGRVEVLKLAKLTDDDIARMESEAFDMGEMYKRISVEEVESIVNSGGDPLVVDSVFNKDKEESKEGSPVEKQAMLMQLKSSGISVEDFKSQFADD